MRTGHAVSRRDAREMVERGAVRLNGHRGIKGAIVSAGDKVEVEALPNFAPIEPDPENAIEVLFEDAAVLVVNKPGGVPCHPLRPGERGTVMNAVAARYPQTATVGYRPIEGGLIHRLDNGTSGALLIARTAEAFALLRPAIRAGAVKRKYLALVNGSLNGTLHLNAPVAHHPKNARKMIVATDDVNARRLAARAALTRVDPLRAIENCTLVTVTPASGTRHQIRVHLASAGFPIVGDELYGSPRSQLDAGRFWLHLSELEFDLPTSGRIKVSAPLAADLAKLISPPN